MNIEQILALLIDWLQQPVGLIASIITIVSSFFGIRTWWRKKTEHTKPSLEITNNKVKGNQTIIQGNQFNID